MAGIPSIKSIYKAAVLFGFLIFSVPMLQAQENPPIPVEVEVRNSRFLNFGSFTGGQSGGTVTVDDLGTRTATGEVFLLNLGDPPSSAIFDLKANPGTLITITTNGDYFLDGNNGGEVRLVIDSFSTGQTFITTAVPPLMNEIFVGGTLHIGNETQSPPGYYTGSFSLTFNYE